MSAKEIPDSMRINDAFHHIDMGFLNRRLALRALPPTMAELFNQQAKVGSDHFTQLGNDHLLVTMLEDVYEELGAPTLLEVLENDKPKAVFRSTEKLASCPEIYKAERVEHEVLIPIKFKKPVVISYHTSHLVSDTGKMTLARGSEEGYVQSIIGILHNEDTSFRIEPIVIGAPWFDHPRNGENSSQLMWLGQDFGEILPEDIDEFSKMREVEVANTNEWQDTMSNIPETEVKKAIAELLNDTTKKDWGGESDDHFTANATVSGRRRTAAFLLKGPTNFREMTLEMCGKRADQIYRLAKTSAEILIVQHSHQIGDTVRATLRAFAIQPGGSSRKYCLIDGLSTYRILKAYNKV